MSEAANILEALKKKKSVKEDDKPVEKKEIEKKCDCDTCKCGKTDL